MASGFGRALTLAGAALVLTASPVHATHPAGTADDVRTGGGVEHLANVPKQAPFARSEAYNSDLAFQGRYAYQGNYHGFTVYDIKTPAKPKVVSRVACYGAQGDVSVHGDLLFLSVDESLSGDSCKATSASPSDRKSWEGVRIFDVSDKTSPKYIKSVETACGSHTHTLVPGRTKDAVYLYVSSYGPGEMFPGCEPPHDKISIVKVPVNNPKAAKVVATPVLFPDGGNETGPGLLAPTSGCHDITVHPARNLAAGACMGDGVLMDISDRENPRVTATVTDANFAFWHSATFNNAGTKVVFTDELGGGMQATCTKAVGSVRGANAVHDIADGELVKRAYFKIPRRQGATENCVAHNGSLIPVKGRDIMVQGWYQGGVSVWDFTDSARPVEIGHFDRGAHRPRDIAGSWSAYYYNGHVYSSEIQRGLDVLRISDRRTDPAAKVRQGSLNAQTQYPY